MLSDLIGLFKASSPLLESKGSFILRRLCLFLDPSPIYVALAQILLEDNDP